MAIAHGSTTVATGKTASLDITSHTVSGSDLALIVKVAIEHATSLVTAVVWDSAGVNESFTKLNRAAAGNASSELWYLANPTAKTATVTITLDASKEVVGAASTYTGVDQTNPFRTAAASTNTGTDASPTVDVVALNTEMVVDSLAQVSAGPDTATGDHTERHDAAYISTGDDVRGASQEKSSTGATEAMGWTMSDADQWTVCAGPLQEPQGIVHVNTTTASSNSTSLLNITGHTVSGANPVLVVKIAIESGSTIVSAVRWDPTGVDESLTQLNTVVGGDARVDLWYLANPTAKTALVKITFTGLRSVIGAASTYIRVDQTNPFRTAAKASATGTNASPTVDVVALDGEMVVDSLCQVSDGPDTATADHTERHNIGVISSFSDQRGASQEKLSTGATETMGWSMSAADNWGIVAGPLQEPQAGGLSIPVAMHHYTKNIGAG